MTEKRCTKADVEELQAIGRQIDTTGEAWVAAGYPDNGPTHDAREAAYLRLRKWNAEHLSS